LAGLGFVTVFLKVLFFSYSGFSEEVMAASSSLYKTQRKQ